jgi:sterol desaturase/sphingolipid hydroxylase (fatty acid hydroxylase superfamily)
MVPLNIVLLRGLISWGGFVLFLCFELVRPYRKPSVSKMQRLVTNISLTVLNSAVLSLIFASATINTALYVSEKQLGLLNIISLPLWLKAFLAVLFMDFMLYVWHLLNHEVPLFWRFHRVHHSDLNMDVSTATRFHIGELAISAVIKVCLIYFIGADLISVIIFESLLVLTAQFQHSSLNAPESFEKFFWIFFVPPSMHRIHHSVKILERDTNYGTILSVWDRLLGTLLKDIPQETIIIGVGPYREPEKLGLPHLLLMPFTKPIK